VLFVLADRNGVLPWSHEQRVAQRGASHIVAVDQDVGVVGIRGQGELVDTGLGGAESLLRGAALRGRCLVVLLEEHRKVLGGVSFVSGAQLTLRQIEQHRWMRLERIGLQERRARLGVLFAIEEGHALLESLSGHLERRVVIGGVRGARRAECDDDDGAEQRG
jgi:hypothetical protein